MTSIVEQEYHVAIAALSPRQRMERCAAMFAWSREMVARQILRQQGPLPVRQLKWEVARRIYQDDPKTLALIEQELSNVLH